MQFVPNGPDIPDALLQAHEEGRVVFFCGAGISYPAGLPDFKGLVEKIYELSGTKISDSDIEQTAFNACQFDVTLDLLERRLPGQRQTVRAHLAQALIPKLRRKGAIDTQAALLDLARNREGVLRLVTTNFDRIFHAAAKRSGQTFQAYAAPMLPIPKNSRWDGLVYLHGVLPEKADATALNRLVITSGDFGLAYLTERWAARFVSELFRNYVVCFVGYSINDPVLRYMMDALAADRRLGEVVPQAWVLGAIDPTREDKSRKSNEWKAKGVEPILYNISTNDQHHSTLHLTLHAWADTYRNGVEGKEAIVVKHALARPQESTQQDDFVGRMLWALSDKSGLPAKRFAEFNPVPDLDWLLGPFTDPRFEHSDLPRFGVSPREEMDSKQRFGLIQRPTPYDHAQPMLLVSGRIIHSSWDHVMRHMARWLVRHLDDPRLIIWIAERGGCLHDYWKILIEKELDHFASLEREKKITEINEIRLHAPKAIPGQQMRTLWRLLLSNRVKSPSNTPDLYRWKDRLKRDGLTATLRLDLRDLLSPKIVLRKPFRWGGDDASKANEPTSIKQLVDWDLELAADHVRASLPDLADEHWTLALPNLLEDFQQLLRDALDLRCELGEADEHSDFTYWNLPSISSHPQNHSFHDWVKLIEFLRDAWLAIRVNDSARATRIAQNWFELPYPTFKRLALFAASQDGCIPPEQWVNWLLADGAKWLWCIDTRREVLRLFVLQGRNLAGSAQDLLEAAILAGLPHAMKMGQKTPDNWEQRVLFSTWLYLAKLDVSGLALGASAAERLMEISTANPKWQLAPDERDEFAIWVSGTDEPDYEDTRDIEIAPRRRQKLVQWLLKPKSDWPFYQDTWREVCCTRFFHSLLALCDLAQVKEWPADRWREALQAWAEDGMVQRSWRYAAPLVLTMPDTTLLKITRDVAWWMETASKAIHRHEDILLNLCLRVLELPLEAKSGASIIRDGVEIYPPLLSAINHPIGHTTQALIKLWIKQKPNDNDLLPTELKPIFTKLCNVQVDRFRHGRVLLGSRLIAFFRVDRAWTEKHLLPLFDWSNPVEAKAVWEGFLWSPRLYDPLLTAFKPLFLETAEHYADLGEHRQQFAMLLTYVALDPADGYTTEELRTALAALPKEGLEESAQALFQALAGTADQSANYWKSHAQPFWKEIWPKSLDLVTEGIARSLTCMVIAAKDAFPDALNEVMGWLKPIEHPDHVVRLLQKSGLCSKFPADALSLLNAVIDDQPWAPSDLKQCLDQIVKAAPNLQQDHRYLRLHEYCRRCGM